MTKFYPAVLLLFIACSSPQTREEPIKEEPSFSPKIHSNSLGMVITNTDKFAYRDMVFTLTPAGGNASFSFKTAALDTAKRLGLRWVQFRDKKGISFPKSFMKAEKVSIEAKKPDGKPVSMSFNVDQAGY